MWFESEVSVFKKKAAHHHSRDDWEVPDRKRNWVVRVGIAILGIAVVISSLIPMLSFFQH